MASCVKPVETAKIDTSSDQYVRERTVMLLNEDGSCTGVQIKAPSGKVYVLTALHCAGPEETEMRIISEHGRDEGLAKIIDRADVHDLMLVESIDQNFVVVAEHAKTHDHIRSFGHAYMMPSIKSEGEIVMGSGGVNDICLDDQREFVVTTLLLGQGDSGGPDVNDAGELVGLNHAIDARKVKVFGCISRLYNIKEFIKNR